MTLQFMANFFLRSWDHLNYWKKYEQGRCYDSFESLDTILHSSIFFIVMLIF
jgi:hypothetical protein